MSGLEADQAYRRFDLPESAHSTVLQKASINKSWTPDIVNIPGAEIDEDLYAEGILRADPREDHNRHDLLIEGRLERYMQNIEEGKNRWDLVLTEKDFYQHPDEFEVDEEVQHNRDPEDELKKGDADLLFLDLDEYDIHMVEAKPHEGYAENGQDNGGQKSEHDSWREMESGYRRTSETEESLDRSQIYDFVAETYPEASQQDAEEVLENFSGFEEEVVFTVLSKMSEFTWDEARSEVQRVAEKDQIPAEYQSRPDSFAYQEQSTDSSGEEKLSQAEKKARSLSEAWKTVEAELDNDWTIYEPEFVFGSDVLDKSSLSHNPEYALPPRYEQETGYSLGTDAGFEKAENSDDLETLNETFFRGEITELLEGERPEMERKSVV
jgi:hypothetical protein